MDRYQLTDLLPVHGSPGLLLTAAIKRAGQHLSLSELGREAGLSKFTASRAAEPLTDAGLLTRTDAGHTLDQEHPLAPLAQSVVAVLTGITTPDQTRLPDPGPFPPSDDFTYVDLLPPSLRLPDVADVAEAAGPSVLRARLVTSTLETTYSDLREFERIGQQVYARWHNERLRDFVHQAIHLGTATLAAITTLDSSLTASIDGPRPDRDTIDASSWARATYLVNAELHRVTRVVSLLEEAVQVGQTLRRLHTRELEQLRLAVDVDTHSLRERAAHRLDTAQGFSADATDLDERTRGRLHSFGGSPRSEDVGDSGDQILAVMLRLRAQHLCSLVADLAGEEPVDAWARQHPDESAAYPLIETVAAPLPPNGEASPTEVATLRSVRG